MEQLNCNGEEKHSHYQMDSAVLSFHTHKHAVREKELNRLHHHPPAEHGGLTYEELEYTESLEIPF